MNVDVNADDRTIKIERCATLGDLFEALEQLLPENSPFEHWRKLPIGMLMSLEISFPESSEFPSPLPFAPWKVMFIGDKVDAQSGMRLN